MPRSIEALPFLLCCVLALSSVPASAQAIDVEQLAALVRSTVPRNFGRQLVLVDAQTEDGVLVVVVTGPARAFAHLGEPQIANLFASGFCRGRAAPAMFRAGLRMRVDTEVDGRRSRGLLIDRCPGDVSNVT